MQKEMIHDAEHAISEVVVNVRGLLTQQHELVYGNHPLGTWVLPWRGNPRFIGKDGKNWEIERRSSDMIVWRPGDNGVIVGRLLEIQVPMARIIFDHTAYRLEPDSRVARGINYELKADDRRLVLMITREGCRHSQFRIVLYQSSPTVLVIFAYYMVYWLLDFAPYVPLPGP